MAKSRAGVGKGSKHEKGKVKEAIDKLNEVVSKDGNRKVTYLEAMANSSNKSDVREVKRLISIINSANNKNMTRMEASGDTSFAYEDRDGERFTVKGLSGKSLVTEAMQSMKYYKNKSNTVTGYKREAKEISEEFKRKTGMSITKRMGRWIKRAIDEFVDRHPTERGKGSYNIEMLASFAIEGKWNERKNEFESFDNYEDFYKHLEEYFYPTNGKIEENANSKSYRF